MRRLFIHHHTGLGDQFDCNALVRAIYWQRKNVDDKGFDIIHVFSKNNHLPIIEYMYRDNDGIVVEEIDSSLNEYEQVNEIVQKYTTPETDHKVLVVGHQYYLGSHDRDVKENKNCWEYFYDQVGLDYDIRHEGFYVLRDETEEKRVFDKLNPKGEPFVFVHDSPDRGYTIDRSHITNKGFHIVENDLEENPLHFLKIIEEASEIHCIESSFKTLIEFYEDTDNLNYHDLRNHSLGNHTKKKWNVIKYDNN